MSEFKRIQQIQRILEGDGRGSRVLLGIGDDAAVLARPQSSQVLSVDTAVEGRHFRSEWASAGQIGKRAAVAALSDLAAMGASPTAMLLSLLVPDGMEDGYLCQLVAGVADAARTYGAPVIGGNLSGASELSITTTVLGETESPLLRSGARPGDRLYCSGVVGAAALGLQYCLLGQRQLQDGAPFVSHYLEPRAHIEQGLALHGHAHACIDVSDGLLQDLGHLCAASNVGARVDYEAVPRLAGFDALSLRLGLDSRALALGGGDDYVLLFAATAERALPVAAHAIGWIEEADAGVRVYHHGEPVETTALQAGFQHFRG